MDSWTKALDRGESIDVVYLDFMIALDAVPQKRYTHTHILIQAFLFDRVQQVNVNGTHSEWANVTSGIPQGNGLVPIPFVLFI